ncbi:hypothetical protein B0H34DRAFT_810645 [Crassisporium funariophilum]|nr:hypothetical protein B0H34DRAFT_810645 [Crassisporium funariophilum]
MDIDNEAQDPHAPTTPVNPAHELSPSPHSSKSDPDDGNYSLPRRANPQITPQQRKIHAEQLSDGAKKRIGTATASLAELRCVVKNSPAEYGVQYAHILRRAAQDNELTKLEYSWGMKYGTLHVDSRYNVMRLEAVLHHLFDNNQWLLLPELHIIKIYLTASMQRPIKNFKNLVPAGPYNYKLVATDKLKGYKLDCYNGAPTCNTQAEPNHFAPYYFPFDNLPMITSHIHPRFVICNTGRKVNEHEEAATFVGDNNVLEAMATVQGIYLKWMGKVPKKFCQHLPSLEDNDGNSSTGTRECRYDFRSLQQRVLRNTSNPSPSHGSGSRSRSNLPAMEEADAAWLDDETLHGLDRPSPDIMWKRKNKSVSAWVSGISKVEFDAIDDAVGAVAIICSVYQTFNVITFWEQELSHRTISLFTVHKRLLEFRRIKFALGNDRKDTSFMEPDDQKLSAYITPEDQREGLGEQTDAAKRRVQKATEGLTKLRCIILNTPAEYGVQYAHLMPREASQELLSRLEYSWGRKFGSLNVDGPHNVMRLEITLHRMFNNGMWMLLPEERIIDAYLNRHKRPDQEFEELVKEETYKYTFVPGRKMTAFVMSRYKEPMQCTQQAGPNDFLLYRYPFDDFPIITSHVHPRYVICNIGLKTLSAQTFPDFFSHESTISTHNKRMIEKASQVFRKWTEDIPADPDFHQNIVQIGRDRGNST